MMSEIFYNVLCRSETITNEKENKLRYKNSLLFFIRVYGKLFNFQYLPETKTLTYISIFNSNKKITEKKEGKYNDVIDYLVHCVLQIGDH